MLTSYAVSKGADIEIKDRWGFNAYQNALQNGHPEIAEFLNHSAVFVMKVYVGNGSRKCAFSTHL